jgi:hypothetical protein
LELLVEPDGTPSPIAKRYAEQFSDIYIDEYQDVDRVQDLIFSAISRSDNRFMVGDIKQSIYSFRGAEPQVFAEYRTSFPAHDSEAAKQSDRATIFMSENSASLSLSVTALTSMRYSVKILCSPSSEIPLLYFRLLKRSAPQKFVTASMQARIFPLLCPVQLLKP